MVELATLVLSIPDAVEAFVKTCRAIESYRNIEEKHKETMINAIHYCRKLNYYANFVDVPRPSDSQDNRRQHNRAPQNTLTRKPLEVDRDDPQTVSEDSQAFLYDVFNNALLALSAAQRVVDEWTLRLRIDIQEKRRGQRLIAALALSLSNHLMGRERKLLTVSNVHNKVAFMIIGCQQIDDAMRRLRMWLRELHDVLVTSPLLHLHLEKDKGKPLDQQDDFPDDMLFVAMARERERNNRMVTSIQPELVSQLRPLDDRKGQNFRLVESTGSPFSGCLVDRRDVTHLINDGKGDEAYIDTERIARLFAEEKDKLGHEITASVGILPCCGVSRPEPEYHDLVFRLPPGTRRPRTLRTLLLEGPPRHSLDCRLDLCIKLATSVLIIHSLNLVHKDIRPDSIIVVDPIFRSFPDNQPIESLGEPYLVAFNESRSTNAHTVPSWKVRSAERRWETLYMHPRHLATKDHYRYEVRDDVYSLGLCLLEVALWRSLFVWDQEQKMYLVDTSLCDLSQQKYIKMLEEMGEDTSRSQSWFRQMDLVRLAEEKVPVTMGNTFKDVVVECLTFGMGKQSLAEVLKKLQPDSTHMKNQSLTFIRNVLSKLRSLKLS